MTAGPPPAERVGKLKNYLLAWTLGPIAMFMAMDSVSLYRNMLHTTAQAHDRLLQATAQQMGDLLRVERNSLTIHVPLALIEALERAGGSRIYWRVIGFDGQDIAGDADLPLPTDDKLRRQPGLTYSYVAQVGDERVHVVALHQPVELSQGQGVAMILLGETLEARQATAAALLRGMLVRQLLLMAVIAVLTWLVVHRALRPLNALRNELQQRSAQDTTALASRGQEELQPVIDEMNLLLSRQQELLVRQRRFVADASHQLRTPLTVLKTQLQTVLYEHVPCTVVLPEMLRTVDRATHLANQLLSKARLEQAQQACEQESVCVEEVVRDAVLALSPLIAAKRLAFSLDAPVRASVQGSPWMVGELVRNLLSNAIRHSPEFSEIGVCVTQEKEGVRMTVWDSGPGIDEDMRVWLLQPFATGKGEAGAGLGLAICVDIARSMHACMELVNRLDTEARVQGLRAQVFWANDHGAAQAHQPPFIGPEGMRRVP